MFVRTRIQTMSLAESRLSSEEEVGRGERERRTEEPRQGRGGREAGKEKEENVVSEKETTVVDHVTWPSTARPVQTVNGAKHLQEASPTAAASIVLYLQIRKAWKQE